MMLMWLFPVNIDRFKKRFLNLQMFFKPYKGQIILEKSTKIFDWFEKGLLKDLYLKLLPQKFPYNYKTFINVYSNFFGNHNIRGLANLLNKCFKNVKN